MDNITFIEKAAFKLYAPPHREMDTYIPVYMVKGKKEYFVRNRELHVEKDDTLERMKEDLINNNGTYVKEYGFYDNPYDLIDYVKRKKYTFEKWAIRGAKADELFEDYRQGAYGEGFIDFSGGTCEVSCVFSYRIYNGELYRGLREAVESLSRLKGKK